MLAEQGIVLVAASMLLSQRRADSAPTSARCVSKLQNRNVSKFELETDFRSQIEIGGMPPRPLAVLAMANEAERVLVEPTRGKGACCSEPAAF